MKPIHQLSDQELKDQIIFLKTRESLEHSNEKAEVIAKVSFQSKIAVTVYLAGLLVIIFSATFLTGLIVGNPIAAFLFIGFVLMFTGFFLLTIYPNWISKRVEKYFDIILKESYGNHRSRKSKQV